MDKVRILNIAEGLLEECKYYLIPIKGLVNSEIKNEFCLAEKISKLLYTNSNKIMTPDS